MSTFEWDDEKETENQRKHKISFEIAQYAFEDPNRIIAVDVSHSTPQETRYFCTGKIKEGIVTIRFTYRKESIRIFGAGYWRKERKYYEKKNQVH
jgi:hypothetical protein